MIAYDLGEISDRIRIYGFTVLVVLLASSCWSCCFPPVFARRS